MSITHICIGANLAMLETRLAALVVTVRAAADALRDGKRNQAIGTLLPIEQDLAVAAALFQTILTLHRMPLGETGGAQ